MLFKSEKGKAIILNHYQQKLESLGIDYTERCIETTFGATNIIVSGNENRPPLMLIHGTGGCAPLILDSFPELNQHYCVYAIDVLAQPNKSAENRLNMKSLDYGIWLTELITKLSLSEIRLVGFSFGGLISLKALEFNPTPIKEVFLIAPVYIVNGNPLVNLWKMFIPLKKFIKTNELQYIKKVMQVLFSEHDDFAVRFLSDTFRYCHMDFSPLPVISKRSAKAINTPITIYAAEKDIMFPGAKMIKRAQKIFPSLQRSVLLNNAKHVPSAQDFAQIQSEIISSLRKQSQ